MPKMIVLRGLPRSGKTKVAKDILSNDNSFNRLSKLDFYKNSIENNQRATIKDAVRTFAYTLKAHLLSSKNIIIDDLNLSDHHIHCYKSLADKFGYTFEEITLNTPIEECVKRDIQQGNKIIGENCIRKFAKKFYLDKTKDDEKEFVVYGLDGCIANVNHRKLLALDDGSYRNSKFSNRENIFLDGVNNHVVKMLKEDFDAGYRIVIITLRPERLRIQTESWLNNKGIDYHDLIMKEDSVINAEPHIKYDTITTRYNFSLCKKIVDDNVFVIRKFENCGVQGFYVNNGIIL